MNKETAIKYLTNSTGQPHGVLLEEELWQKVCSHVLGVLEELCPSRQELAEPIADYALLEKYWDLRYELPTDVSCETCGSTTPHWQEDEPRKFILRAANMGGLLAFECMACHSRITKRHFKDKITVTCAPQPACACAEEAK